MKKKGISLFAKYYLTVGTGIVLIFSMLSVALTLFVSEYITDVTTQRISGNTKQVIQILENDDLNLNELTLADRAVLQYTLDIFSSANESDIIAVSDLGVVSVTDKDCKYDLQGTTLPDYLLEQIKKSADEGVSLTLNFPEIQKDKVILVSGVLPKGGYIVSISALDSLSQSKSAIRRILLMCVFFALTVSVAVVYFLAYRTLKPLKQLSFATKKIASGDYSYRVEIDGDDEFKELGDAFNDMAQSLDALENSRRSFIANISHELKTPMTTIGGFVDGIIDGTIPHDKQNKYLSIVSSEVKRLARLVVAMLDLSKIEAGELTLKRERVDVSQMVFDILLSFEQMIAKKGIEIRGLDTMSKLSIDVDRDMIYQVFYNLIDNAVKFTDRGGYIAVTAMLQDGKYIFRIKNKCGGISTEEMSKIFERFYKVDKSHSREVKGVGLGLYLVKTIVEMHGGQVTVLSEEGENCEFLFWLPADIASYE